MFENNMKFTRAACGINSKIWTRGNSTIIVIFFCYHYCWSLLWCDYWRSAMLPKSSSITSWSRLKLTFQIQLTLHPRNSFFINNCYIIANSVEKHCVVMLNVSLQVKTRLKTFYWFLEVLYLLLPKTALPTALTNSTCLLELFAFLYT